MNKIRKSIVFISLLLLGIAVSCNLFASTAQKATEMPAPPVLSTETAPPTETATPSATPTRDIPIPSATLEFAPICQDSTVMATPAQCHVPIAEQTSTFCKKKKPYNLILLNKDATYEAQGGNIRCFDNGVKDDGRKIVVCTGNMAMQFEVTTCDPTCVVAPAGTTSTQCPPDYNYNNLLGCCTQGFQSLQPNCVTLKLETIRCLIDCSVYTKKATCNQNSFACTWHVLDRVCLPR